MFELILIDRDANNDFFIAPTVKCHKLTVKLEADKCSSEANNGK